MTDWNTRFTPSARQDLRAIPQQQALRILTKLAALEASPYGLDTTELAVQPGYRRLRIGPHRAICTLDHTEIIIWVIAVAPRATIYRKQPHET
jgi:mRNA interferase RelE/StbE